MVSRLFVRLPAIVEQWEWVFCAVVFGMVFLFSFFRLSYAGLRVFQDATGKPTDMNVCVRAMCIECDFEWNLELCSHCRFSIGGNETDCGIQSHRIIINRVYDAKYNRIFIQCRVTRSQNGPKRMKNKRKIKPNRYETKRNGITISIYVLLTTGEQFIQCVPVLMLCINIQLSMDSMQFAICFFRSLSLSLSLFSVHWLVFTKMHLIHWKKK